MSSAFMTNLQFFLLFQKRKNDIEKISERMEKKLDGKGKVRYNKIRNGIPSIRQPYYTNESDIIPMVAECKK